MRPRLRLLTLAVLAALAAGCAGRDRANPLDPANPSTGGRPVGFASLAGYAIVTLTWTPQPALSIDGFRVLRLAPGDSLWRPLGPVSPATQQGALDLTVSNGATYRYRLYYVIRGALANLPAEDQATPGPLRPWVADAGAGQLDQLTPDGRHVVSSATDAGGLQSLAVDPSTSRVWTSASLDGMVTVREPGGLFPVLITGLSQPFTLAVSPLDHGAWVCELGGSLAHLAPDGSRLAPGEIPNLGLPTGVAVSPHDYSVWLCENGGNSVRHYDSSGGKNGVVPLPLPSRVAVDSVSGRALVTSFNSGRVWLLSATTAAVTDSSSAASGPIGIAVDPRRGHVWVADALGNRVLVLDSATLAVLLTVPGISEPRDVDVDLATGEAWVVARGTEEILRLSPTGQVLQRLGGFSDLAEVRLDPGL